MKVIGFSTKNKPIVCYEYENGSKYPWIFLSSGIHGCEPAGINFLLELIQANYFKNFKLNFLVIPLINPDGFAMGTRENSLGIDLNRDFKEDAQSVETKVVMNFLKERGLKFETAIDFHETLPHEVVDGMPAPKDFYMWEVNHDVKNRVGGLVLENLKRHSIPVCLDEKIWGDINSKGVIYYPEGCASTEYSQARSFDIHLMENYTTQAITTETFTEDDHELRVVTNKIVLDTVINWSLKKAGHIL